MEDITEGFGKITDQEWRKKIEKEIKGNFQELLWQDENRLVFQPYYRKSDLLELKELEGIQSANKLDPDWKITQLLQWNSSEGEVCLEAIKSALNSGADSVLLKNDTEAEKLGRILNRNSLDRTSIMVEQNSEMLLKLPESLQNASFLFDPISDRMRNGKAIDLGNSILGKNTEEFFDNNNFKLLVDGTLYKEAGSNHVQELAFILQHALEYFDFFTERGVDAKIIAGKIVLKVGIGLSFFPEIAKVRALRYLWNKLMSAYQIKSTPVIIAESASYNLSLIEPYNNLLRETTQVLSAAFSNCNFICSPSFDLNSRRKDDFANRMARNIQIILKEESYANKVIDPSAGSYFIEEVTEKFAEAAWEKFMDMESNGGIGSHYEKNQIQKEIELIHEQRLRDLKKKKMKVLGLNIHLDDTVNKLDLGDKNNVEGAFTPLRARNLSLAYLRKEEVK